MSALSGLGVNVVCAYPYIYPYFYINAIKIWFESPCYSKHTKPSPIYFVLAGFASYNLFQKKLKLVF